MAKHPLAPNILPHIAREKMGDTPQWHNFALRIQHHPEIKRLLILQQKGQCPVCHMPVTQRDTVHHVSYLGKCHTGETIEFATPTPKRPDRTTQAPPCAECHQQSRCLRLLALVHDRCHFLIHRE